MNESRRQALILQNVQMALACINVGPLARFYINRAKFLSTPPVHADLNSGSVPAIGSDQPAGRGVK